MSLSSKGALTSLTCVEAAGAMNSWLLGYIENAHLSCLTRPCHKQNNQLLKPGLREGRHHWNGEHCSLRKRRQQGGPAVICHGLKQLLQQGRSRYALIRDQSAEVQGLVLCTGYLFFLLNCKKSFHSPDDNYSFYVKLLKLCV